jgi:hypothetical protein
MLFRKPKNLYGNVDVDPRRDEIIRYVRQETIFFCTIFMILGIIIGYFLLK